MLRREFLRGGPALAAAAALPRDASAELPFPPRPDAWRKFEVTTRVEIVKPAGKAQAWLPLPAVAEPGWTQPLGNEWTTNAKSAELIHDSKYGAQMLHVEWADGERTPVAEVVSRIATRDRSVDLAKREAAAPLSADQRKLYTASTELLPTDGIVKATADKIVGWAFSDVEKARRIYEWIVDNTFRDPKTRGCGIGDIASMLKTGDLGGKCADLNALYVGLARAVGLPARDVYGIRIAPSRFGYKSLGAASDKGATLSRRGLPQRVRLGPGRSGGRAQGGAGRAAGATRLGRSKSGRRTQDAVRRLGDELARLQLRARCRAARLDGSQGGLPHVSASRGQRRAPRRARPG